MNITKNHPHQLTEKLQRLKLFNYLASGLKPIEFLAMCKKYPDYFISYFEVIIAKNGTTYFAQPSHDEKLKELVRENHKVNFTTSPYSYEYGEMLLSAFGYVSVHYNSIQAGAYLTTAQKRALKIYMNAGLISNNAVVHYCHDYDRYKIMNSFTKDDDQDTVISALNVLNNAIQPTEESIYNAIHCEYCDNMRECKSHIITVYEEGTDEVVFKYTRSMDPSIKVEDNNMFSIIYLNNITKLDRYKKCSDYSIKNRCFVMVDVAYCDYPKDKYYYKIK